jgi:hypothetical protein
MIGRAIGAVLLVGLLTSGCASTAREVLPASDTGVEGTVLFGPLCPVERADSPCPPKPIAAFITVTTAAGATVGTGSSEPNGAFRIALAPGTYRLTARAPGSGAFGVSKPIDVVVVRGRYTHVDLMVDSGIR